MHCMTLNPQVFADSLSHIHSSAPTRLVCSVTWSESELLKEDAELNQAGGDAGKAGGVRRRRRAYSRTLSGHMKPSKQYGTDPDHHREGGMGKSYTACIGFTSCKSPGDLDLGRIPILPPYPFPLALESKG